MKLSFSKGIVKICLVFSLAAPLACSYVGAQETGPLVEQIQEVSRDAHGKVSVAWTLLPDRHFSGGVNPLAHPPMQSVFKLPVAIAVLHLVDQGALSLDQSIRFRSEDRFPPPVYSPLQAKYPNAEVDVPLREWLELAVSDSDNVAADRLLELAGGVDKVNGYIASLGVDGFHLMDGERALHLHPERQYRNWFAPQAAVQLLARLGTNSPLTKAHTDLLLKWMLNASTQKRISGDLPEGTRVAHKTGSSDTDGGLTPATNDIGLIFLPDGHKLALAVFVTDSRADQVTRNKVIARIARAIYDGVSRANQIAPK